MAESALPLSGKVALITGASRGIGRDVAVALAEAGADIVIASRSETVTDPRMPGTIYTVAAEVEQRGRRALPVKVDVTRDEEIDHAVEQAMQTFGRIDVLINNAAIQIPGDTRTVQARHLDLIYRVDLRAPLMCIRAVLEPMARTGGHIINVSSRAAVFPGPGPYAPDIAGRARQPFYAMVKAALERYSQALAMELQPDGISVTVLSPEGRIRTPGNKFFENSREHPDLNFEQAVDMGKATVWICRQDPRGFTGQILFDRDVVRENGL
jgi:citronellol/citronellal dehydrogenase